MQLLKISSMISILLLISVSCSNQEDFTASHDVILKANANPSWSVDPRCFLDGASGSFDDIAVKDPSIVYSSGYHLFYTGRSNSSVWSIGYATASSISGLKTATHTKISSLGSGSGIAAPQIFYFASKGKWFLIYQNGTSPSYSTNTSVSSPSGWTATRSMGFADGGIDYWCISDGTNVYLFYSANDGSHQILRRSTTIANFPTGWGSSSVAATSSFEAPCVYKNNADGKYYMMVEAIGRYFQLWTASSLGGTWTLVSEKWAAIEDCTFTGENWTGQVSHGEILRTGTNERLIIDNIDACQVLIQGIPSGSSGTYADLPYDIGLMRNY